MTSKKVIEVLYLSLFARKLVAGNNEQTFHPLGVLG